MEQIGIITDHGEKTPKGVLVDRIVRKVEASIKSLRPLKNGTHFMTSVARVFVPGNYKSDKEVWEFLRRDLKEMGHAYEFDPANVIDLTIALLLQEGKFTDEEITFLNENKVTIKKIVGERLEKDGDVQSDLSIEKPQTLAGKAYKAVSDGARILRKVPRMIDEIREDIENGEGIELSAIINGVGDTGEAVDFEGHEIPLLETNIFKLIQLPPKQFFKKVPVVRSKLEESDRVEYYRRVFNIGGDITATEILEAFESKEGSSAHKEWEFMNQANEVWQEILGYYLDDPADIRRYSFKDDVLKSETVFDLFAILNDLQEIYKEVQGVKKLPEDEKEKKIQELNQRLRRVNSARIKLILYSVITNIRKKQEYSRRNSIKAYLDNFLTNNIFTVVGEKEVQIPGTRKKMTVLVAELRDPDDPSNTINVLLYEGGDSEKPKEPKSGVVNIKSMAKIILKELSEKNTNVRDFFRITVMPEDSKDLNRMREVLQKTIAHPRSRTKASMVQRKDNHSRGSSYKKLDIIKYDINITPYTAESRQDQRRVLRSGYLRDIKEDNELIKMGDVYLEMRTGAIEDITPEYDTKHKTSHRTFSQIRTSPGFNQFLPPEAYEINWIGRAIGGFTGIKENLMEDNRVLPGLVMQRTQQIRLLISKTLTGERTDWEAE